MDNESVPESDASAFADSGFESADPADGFDAPRSDSGGSGAHADGASPYLSRLSRQDAARVGHLLGAARPGLGQPQRRSGSTLVPDRPADDPNSGFARGAQCPRPGDVSEGDWSARAGQRRRPASTASPWSGAAHDAALPPSRDAEARHDCGDDDCGWLRSRGVAEGNARGDRRQRGTPRSVRTRGAWTRGALDDVASDAGFGSSDASDGFGSSVNIGESEDSPHDTSPRRAPRTRLIPGLRAQLRDRRGGRTRGASTVDAVHVAHNDPDGFCSSDVLSVSGDDDEGRSPLRRQQPAAFGHADDDCESAVSDAAVERDQPSRRSDMRFLREECAGSDLAEDGPPDDDFDDRNDENATSRPNLGVIPALRDDELHPRCVFRCGRGRRWGRAVSVVRVFALPGMFLRGCR